MNYSTKTSLAYLGIVLCFIGCQGDEGAVGPSGLNSLTMLAPENTGANCGNGGVKVQAGIDLNANNILDIDEVVSTSYVCNGMDGRVSLTIVLTEPKGDKCENGGIKIDSGVDVNRNGLLDTSEITTTAHICNGVDGNNILTRLTNESAGTNCENGGLKIDSGVDTNNNGTLDNPEIASTAYVCNGVDGKTSLVNVTDEIPGENCKNGGVKITSGIDTNRNGTLDVAEIQVTRYVCNGLDGIINEEIQIRLVDGIGSAANTTSSTPVIVSGVSSFDIRNFVNVDSVIFVADPYVGDHINFALLELYNVTDGQVIANSLLRTNNLSGERTQLKTRNLFDEIPKKQITFGIKLSSETNGQFAASGIPYLFLYRSN